MRYCVECRKKPWPYLIVLLVTGVAAFVTALTLDAGGIAEETNRIWTTGVALGVAGSMLAYVWRYMR
jgi:hypothetical protein